MKSQEQYIKEVTNELQDTLIRKNRDYGNSFAKQFEKYGTISALIRIDDKIERIRNLINTGSAEVDESLEDTFLDLAGYSILTLIELRKTNRK